MHRPLCFLLSVALLFSTPALAQTGPGGVAAETAEAPARFWLESSLQRIYPTSQPSDRASIDLISPRNARFSFQASVHNDRPTPTEFACSVEGAEDLKIQVRRVGYVPQWNLTADVPLNELDEVGHVPGMVPDPLFPEHNAYVSPFTTQTFWISGQVPADAQPGLRKLSIRFKSEVLKPDIVLTAHLQIYPLVVKPREKFPVTHWFCADAIYDYYKQPVFGEDWFKLMPAFLNDMLEHGSDVIMVPMLYFRREIVERPSQLLIVNEPEPGKYEFDWTRVKRFVDMARQAGFNKFEWPHFWSYKVAAGESSVDTPQRLYKWVNGKAVLLWPKDTPATGPIYRNFLTQFLPQFHQFLEQENLLDKSYFHLSDEPGSNPKDVANYKAARALLKELAPWMRVMDAMSDITYGRDKGLIDIPVPALHGAQAYIDEKIPHWVYFCCGPRGPYLNRFFDTPLAKIRMSGWLFYHLKAQGFLHWGYNYWYVMDLSFNKKTQVLVDPFTDSSAGGIAAGGLGEPCGDPFVVYPGAHGPLDSIRWEVFAESLQDYAILQTVGIKPGDPLLSDIKTYAQFPKNEDWIDKTLAAILKRSIVATRN